MAKVQVRRGMPSVQLDKREFKKRFQAKFYDPVFEPLQAEIDKIADAARIAYDEYHTTPRAEGRRRLCRSELRGGGRMAETRANIQAAERRQKNSKSPSRVLIVNGSSRSEHTCPGEMSKTYRLVTIAKQVVEKTRASKSRCSISRGWPRNTVASSIPARHASPRHSPCVIGRAAAVPITRSARRAIGWPSSIRSG